MNEPQFYNLLFDDREGICMSQDKFGTSVWPFVKGFFQGHETLLFVCINPLLVNEDRDPHQSWHSPKMGRRADCNVTVFRNILCEFDKIPLEAQIDYINESKIPYSTLTYSGGKSMHLIISLAEPCKTKEEYVSLVKRIHAKLGAVDTTTSNPSRFSRAPGAIRENGKQQMLVRVGERISREALNAWLGPEEKIVEPAKRTVSMSGKRLLWGSTERFRRYGAPEGSWNVSLFKAVCDMYEAGYSKSEIITMCESITGFLDSKDRSTIDSAINRAKKNV